MSMANSASPIAGMSAMSRNARIRFQCDRAAGSAAGSSVVEAPSCRLRLSRYARKTAVTVAAMKRVAAAASGSRSCTHPSNAAMTAAAAITPVAGRRLYVARTRPQAKICPTHPTPMHTPAASATGPGSTSPSAIAQNRALPATNAAAQTTRAAAVRSRRSRPSTTRTAAAPPATAPARRPSPREVTNEGSRANRWNGMAAAE